MNETRQPSYLASEHKSAAAAAAVHGTLSVLACGMLAGAVYAAATFGSETPPRAASLGRALLVAERTETSAQLPLKQRLEDRNDQPSRKQPKAKRAPEHAADTPPPVTITPLEETVLHVGPALAAVSSALVRAPVAKVHRNERFGIVPVIAADGSRPAEVYARPSPTDSARPAIAVAVGGLGLNRAITQRAIDSLPPEVTLSFVPYAKGLQSWIDKARAAGHETLLEIPMEPYDYPNNDSGPHTLLTGTDKAENIRRLDYLLSRATGYFGLTNYQGEKFATHKVSVAPILDQMAKRGLVFFHDGMARRSVIPEIARRSGLGLAVADRIIDDRPDPDAINRSLLEIEALSLRDGHAFGAGFAFPVTVETLEKWTKGLDKKGFALIPASAFLRLAAVGAPS